MGWSADIPQSEIKGVLSGFECKEFPYGCPKYSLVLDGDGQFMGCKKSGGTCYDQCMACESSTSGCYLCVVSPNKECGSTGGDVDCGKVYYGSCVNPATPVPAGTYHAPGATCDCSIPIPADPQHGPVQPASMSSLLAGR